MEGNAEDRLVHAAAHWYARLQSPLCTADDRSEFDRWRRQDPAHGRVYDAARRLAEDVFDIAAGDARVQAMADRAFEMGADAGGGSRPVPRIAGRRRWVVPLGLAAGIAAAIVAAGAIRYSAGPNASVERVATAAERRELTLVDGTTVHVDVKSEIEVRITRSERLVTLSSGRAIFDVAHDPARPFSVMTDLGRVTALGTRFEVRRSQDETMVTLAEGVVTVSAELAGQTRSRRLEPGDQLSIVSRGEWAQRRVDPVATTSWSIGRLVFRNERLADALEEVNRYAATKVRLADPTLADLPVSGSFVSGDSGAVVAALVAVLPIRVSDAGSELLVFRRPGAEAR
jgi:transmembrane sensor